MDKSGMNQINDALRAIPSVDELLRLPAVQAMTAQKGKQTVNEGIKQVLDNYRKQITNWQKSGEEPEDIFYSKSDTACFLTEKLADRLDRLTPCGPRRVINATGTVLHTNLGRAPLPTEAVNAIREVCEGYSNLEFDLETGGRGSRHSHIEELLARITGAESAIIVNNNAAAVFLSLNTLAASKEVIISRGQLVEIGGSFRIPDIIIKSGARLIEVGTTNKTRTDDYISAVTPDTAVLLKVHTSNYKMTGFTEEVALKELAEISRKKELILMEDLGSGSLMGLEGIGLPHEPTVQESLMEGADLVTFSGDKLLGGIQAGIIAGKKIFIDQIKKNPLARMVRCDKATIAATAAVLKLHLDTEKAKASVPVLKMLGMKEEELESLALKLKDVIDGISGNLYITEIVEELDEAGGGSLPGVVLKGRAVAIRITDGSINENELQARLRGFKIPIVCRISQDRVILNVRTIEEGYFSAIAEALAGICGNLY